MNTTVTAQQEGYVLRFDSLFREGRGFAFPCDASGRVDMDRMNDRLRNTYLFARTVIGREVGLPSVQRV